ncbi:antibiotic biosynthesis monooxygenase [Aspergillus terreus]|uniref:Antibiotic biosynthesis monooxygenase n=1 Tax=Aspergillus terreus TaxID=33178 RepID=A0A5M3ZDK8_ASPTE|nr:hypothetical protein HFD88_005455 [Aspergillus terreus]GES65412.1 hypothetical protein ATETN484_0012031700 [Aspergillus terreus]GFF19565.1 antibiotic biosynthesis monooxygenase [Aspergillus terreus]
MSAEEVNVVAIMYPKPGKHDEAHEPDTLIYYAFSIKDGNEIMVVERYRNQEALQIHLLNPYFQDFGKKAKELMERPYDVKVGSGFLSGSASVTRA